MTLFVTTSRWRVPTDNRASESAPTISTPLFPGERNQHRSSVLNSCCASSDLFSEIGPARVWFDPGSPSQWMLWPMRLLTPMPSQTPSPGSRSRRSEACTYHLETARRTREKENKVHRSASRASLCARVAQPCVVRACRRDGQSEPIAERHADETVPCAHSGGNAVRHRVRDFLAPNAFDKSSQVVNEIRDAWKS